MPKKREKPVPKWSRRLAELRRSTGLTQRAFAEELGISAGAVKRLEVGDLPLSGEMLDRYAGHFHCFPEYITGEKDHRDRRAELFAQLSDADLARRDAWASMKAWIEAQLPPDRIEEFDFFEVYDHIFGNGGYIDGRIQEAIDDKAE